MKITAKDMSSIIETKLDGDVMLKQILYYDWALGDSNSNQFPEGYYGKYILNKWSNYSFYKELILENFNEIWDNVMEGE